MSEVHRLSRRDARRLAVRAQLLDRPRPTDLMDVARRLTLLQLDPTAAVAPNVHLVAWSRLGSAYDPAELDAAVADHRLIELEARLRPAEDIRLFRAEMQQWPVRWPNTEMRDWEHRLSGWVEANDACRLDILRRLEADGPLPSRELPDTCAAPWTSTGWTNAKNVTKLLDQLVGRGEVAVSGRRGRERLWDLAERVYPDVPVPTQAETLTMRNARRLTALGVARATGSEMPGEPTFVGAVGEPAVVAGVRGEWRVDPELLGQPFRGRAALLSPFDRLIHDRKRALELFGFDYQLEMYKPAAQRRWGYFALPVLSGDELVGKLDVTADRTAGGLRVDALHWDVDPTPAQTEAVDAEIADLATWVGLPVVRRDRTVRR